MADVQPGPAPEEIAAYYDDFTAVFVKDYVQGNRRLDRQYAFFRAALPRTARRVLVVGCGLGEGAHVIAQACPQAAVRALDLSPRAIALAQRLFPHPRITYHVADVTATPPDEALAGEAGWDAIVLPDVYEHLAAHTRPAVHARFQALLANDGMLLLTVPTAAHQAWLRATGGRLQPIDETLHLADFVQLAEDVGGAVSYYAQVSVFQANDYAHVVVERGTEAVRRLGRADRRGVKGWPLAEQPGRPLLNRWRKLRAWLRRPYRALRIQRALK